MSRQLSGSSDAIPRTLKRQIIQDSTAMKVRNSPRCRARPLLPAAHLTEV
jgi:hypothetical protein